MTKEMQYPSCKVTVNYDFSITDKNGRHICTDQEGIQEVEIGFIPFEVIKRVSDFNDSLTERAQAPTGFYELQSLARQNPEFIKGLNKFIIGTKDQELKSGPFSSVQHPLICPSEPSLLDQTGGNFQYSMGSKSVEIAPDSRLVAIVLNRTPLDQGKKPLGCSMADIYQILKSNSNDPTLSYETEIIPTSTQIVFDPKRPSRGIIRNYPGTEMQSEKEAIIPSYGKYNPMLAEILFSPKGLKFVQTLLNTKDHGLKILNNIGKLVRIHSLEKANVHMMNVLKGSRFYLPNVSQRIKSPIQKVSLYTDETFSDTMDDCWSGISLNIDSKVRKMHPFELIGDAKGIYREPQQKRRKE